MKIAVIGSNSFSGAHFANHALNQGAQVLGISRSPEIATVFRPYLDNPEAKSFKFLQRDWNRELAEMLKDLAKFRPQWIVNFAAQSMVGQSWSTPEDWYETNVVGISKLTNGMSNIGSLERYVHVTTPEVYGSTANWISEDAPFNPSTPYAVSRAAGDMHMRIMHEHKGFPVLFTRAANVFGEHQQLYRVVPKAFLCALTGREFPLEGGGLSRRSFIHISDVSRATWLIAQKGALGETYHISTDELVSIMSLVERIFRMAGSEIDVGRNPVEDRIGKDAGYFLSSDKLKKVCGWLPEVSLDDGLSKTYEWVRSNLEVLRSLPWEYEHKR